MNIYSQARTAIRTKHQIDALNWLLKNLDKSHARNLEITLNKYGKAEAIRYLKMWEAEGEKIR